MVTVHLVIVDKPNEAIEVAEGATIGDVLNKKGFVRGADEKILVNGINVSDETVVTQNMDIFYTPVIHALKDPQRKIKG